MGQVKSGFLTRALSGAVFAVIMIGGILLSKYTFLALMLVICAGCMREFYKLAEKSGAKPMKWYGMSVGVITVLTVFALLANIAFVWYSGLIVVAGIFLTLSLFIAFIAELYRKTETPLLNIASTIMGFVYVTIPVAALMFVAFYKQGDTMSYSPWVILLYIIIVWANDVGAYLFGMAFGRRKLFERHSPKKSWEGFFGGLIVAVCVGAVVAGLGLLPISAPTLLSGSKLIFYSLLAVVVAATGVWGDLVESMFKRAAGVKDSGAIMPGHGGFLDRFDAVLISAPFVFIYFIIFA